MKPFKLGESNRLLASIHQQNGPTISIVNFSREPIEFDGFGSKDEGWRPDSGYSLGTTIQQLHQGFSDPCRSRGIGASASASADGAGAYLSQSLGSTSTAGTTTLFSRQSTFGAAQGFPAGRCGAGRSARRRATLATLRLQHSTQSGGLLVLTVEPRHSRHAEAELLRRFGLASKTSPPLQRLSFDAMLLKALRAEAVAVHVDWSTVLGADAAQHGSREWTNLQRLVQRTLTKLKPQLLNSTTPVLLTNVGLLARYHLMAMVTEIESTAGRPGHNPSLWLLRHGEVVDLQNKRPPGPQSVVVAAAALPQARPVGH